MEKASALINGMVDNVEEMDVILREIGQASREQTDGISQINSAIGLIDAATQQKLLPCGRVCCRRGVAERTGVTFKRAG